MTPDSDYDLVLFSEPAFGRPPFEECVEGYELGVEYRSLRPVQDWTLSPRLGFADLRFAGRLALSLPVASSLDLPAGVRSRAAAALLEPTCAWGLFQAADLARQAERGAGGQDWDDLYTLQGAVAAICVLVLNLAPVKYQKAKWVVSDLDRIGRHDLVSLVAAGYGRASGGLLGIRRVLDAVQEHFSAGLQLMTAALALERDAEDHRLEIAAHNYAGVAGLLESGQALAALHTAMAACRLVYTAVSSAPDTRLRGAAHDWRDKGLELACPEEAAHLANRVFLAGRIAEVGRATLGDYRLALSQGDATAGCSRDEALVRMPQA